MPMLATGNGGRGHDIAIPCLHVTRFPVGAFDLRSAHAQLESGKTIDKVALSRWKSTTSRQREPRAQALIASLIVRSCPQQPQFPCSISADSMATQLKRCAYLARRLPDCSLTLIQVTGFAPGQCRLVGQIDANDRERLANIDPKGEHSRAKLLGDALTRGLLSRPEATTVRVNGNLALSPFAHAFANPAAILGIPVTNAGAVRHWFVFGSAAADHFDALSGL